MVDKYLIVLNLYSISINKILVMKFKTNSFTEFKLNAKKSMQ